MTDYNPRPNSVPPHIRSLSREVTLYCGYFIEMDAQMDKQLYANISSYMSMTNISISSYMPISGYMSMTNGWIATSCL